MAGPLGAVHSALYMSGPFSPTSGASFKAFRTPWLPEALTGAWRLLAILQLVRPSPASRARTLTWLLCWNNCQTLVRKAPLREPPRRPGGSPAGWASPSFTFRAGQLWAMGQVNNAPTLASSWVSQLSVILAPLALICRAVA